MVARIAASAALLLVLFSAGCGSSNGNGPRIAFFGKWNGPWSAVTPGSAPIDRGTMSLIVEADGHVHGTVLNRLLDQTWNITGTVTPGGVLAMSFWLPPRNVAPADASMIGDNPRPEDVVANYLGNAAVGAGHLTGNANSMLGATVVGSIAFDLQPPTLTQ